jgi:hypothetical protein
VKPSQSSLTNFSFSSNAPSLRRAASLRAELLLAKGRSPATVEKVLRLWNR